MRCLWLTWVDPCPEHDGQRIYSGRMISAVAEAGAKIHVLCGASELSPRSEGDEEAGVTWHPVPHSLPPAWTSVGSGLPHIAHRSAVPTMQRRLFQALQAGPWDSIVFDGIGTGWALPYVVRTLQDTARPCRLVYVAHNHEASMRRRIALRAEGSLLRRIMLRQDAVKIARLERRLVEAADVVTAITPDDATLFERDAGAKPIVVLPPGYNGRRVAARQITEAVPRRAIVVGSFDWVAKQMNLEEFLSAADPLFAAAGAEIEVVGTGAPGFFDRLRGGLKATRLVGRVDSLMPHLDEARIAVVAERLGGGFKLKVLDYVFNRLPVAALDGSVAGTPLTPNDSILTFAHHRPLAEGVLSALDDLALLNRLQSSAYQACARRFDWSDRGRQLAATIAAP